MNETSNTNWLKGTTGTVFLGLVTSFIYDWIKEKPLLSTVRSIFKSIWDFIYQLLITELKIWWILAVFILIKTFQVLYKNYIKSKTPSLPENLENYVSDSFKNWNWKWDWKWDGKKNRWRVESLWPYCKVCDIKLLDKSTLLNELVECPKCRERFTNNRDFDDHDGVETVIYHNIENKRIGTH